ncbi:MAG: DUF1634 domain-containing protein [Bacillota bacterium]
MSARSQEEHPTGSCRARRDIEDVISAILRWGVFISAAVVGVGVVLLLVTGSTGTAPLAFAPGKLLPYLGQGPTGPREAIRGLVPPQPYSVIALGLMLLILTPIVRVAASLAVFLRDRDRTYAVITCLVLVVLAVSFLLGAGAH